MQKHKQTKATTKKAGKARKATKPARTTAKAPARTKAPKAAKPAQGPRSPRERDPRLPAPGTVLVRPYKGKEYRVTVLEDGFRHEGTEYRSLSKLASVISGQPSVNGFLWWKLTQPGQPAPKPRKAKGKAPAAEPAATETAPATEAPTA